MSLDAVWRIPFLSPEVNSAITQTAYETIKEVVNQLKVYCKILEREVAYE